jgi:hypothetical protein
VAIPATSTRRVDSSIKNNIRNRYRYYDEVQAPSQESEADRHDNHHYHVADAGDAARKHKDDEHDERDHDEHNHAPAAIKIVADLEPLEARL